MRKATINFVSPSVCFGPSLWHNVVPTGRNIMEFDILILSKLIIYQLMRNRTVLKRILQFTLKQLPTCFGVTTIIRELIVVNWVVWMQPPDDGDNTGTCRSCFNVNCNILFKAILLCISW